jgi:hypothetical protein
MIAAFDARLDALANAVRADLGPGAWFVLFVDDGVRLGVGTNAPRDAARRTAEDAPS